MKKYKTVDEFILDAKVIRDKLSSAGEIHMASELSEVIDHPWTFGSEALGEIGIALQQSKATAKRALTLPDQAFLDEIIHYFPHSSCYMLAH